MCIGAPGSLSMRCGADGGPDRNITFPPTGAPTEMTRPDHRTPNGKPSVYARLAAQVDLPEVERPVPAWSHWAGRVLVAAILVMVVIVVTQGGVW